MKDALRSVVIWMVAMLMIALCFFGGWYAYDYNHASRAHITFDFSKPHALPSGYMKWYLVSSAENRQFAVGDRIDLLHDVDGELQPIAIDAIVVQQMPNAIELYVPLGSLHPQYAEDWRSKEVRYRPTIAIADPVKLTHDDVPEFSDDEPSP